jgi:hypothetical protein
LARAKRNIPLCKRGVNFTERSKPNFIELLSERRKSCVYRLDGVGPGGTAVIAKRSRAGEAHVEQTIYEEVLPDLPISSLTFYGVVDEPGTEFRWLFLEDAENADFTYFSEQHRKLAARWLGLMHVCAERVFAVSRLPDRGPQHYLDHLHSSRRIIEGNLEIQHCIPKILRYWIRFIARSSHRISVDASCRTMSPLPTNTRTL